MMDAILLAGGIPKADSPLYQYTQGKPKAALEIAGKPMLQWVLDALELSRTIQSIVIVGCEELQGRISSSKVSEYLPADGDMMLNFKIGADALLASRPETRSAAIVSSDIPLVTPESIDWVISTAQAGKEDLFYFVVDQAVMEGKYPDSGRSYTRLKDLNLCGGDIAVVNLDLISEKQDFWRRISEARKSSLRQASLIGLDILLLLLLRRLTLAETVDRITRRLRISGRGILCPYPEVAMDIDKPDQFELAVRELG